MKTIICLLISCIVSTAAAQQIKLPPRPAKYTRHSNLVGRVEVKPLFDTPLRHTFIARGPDGAYYLTGTASKDDKGEDFQNNPGVRLWKSPDMKRWEDIGFVWEVEKHAAASPKSAWQLERNLNPDNPGGPLVRGITAPEIHYLKGTWWIAYSMNSHGTGLLRSTSGKPQGPYQDIGRMTGGEGNASLFEDFDGSVYWVWGPGRIAKLKDDLSGFAESPRQLTLALNQDSLAQGTLWHVARAHLPESTFLFKTTVKTRSNGKEVEQHTYHLSFESGANRLGGYTKDSFIATSRSLSGPFEKYEVLLDHGAQSNVFQDDAGNWFGTFYGDDPSATFRDRPAIVTMDLDRALNRPERPRDQFTTRGPWATAVPLFDDAQVNDEQILNAPDGFYYFTGSVWDDFRFGGLTVWKSKTLEPRSVRPENWQEIRACTYADIPIIRALAGKDPSLLDFTVPRAKTKLGAVMWNPEIHYLKGTFWMMGQLGIPDPAVKAALEKEGIKGSPLWRSTTGKAEGPYEVHAWIPYSCPTLFQDDDASVYLLEGVCAIAKLKDDMSGVDTETTRRIGRERGIASYGDWNNLKTREDLNMDYDIGNCMVKIGGKYVYFTCNVIGGYDYQYYVSKDIWGPYSRPRVMMPHGGHSFVMKDKEGKWHSLQWAGTTAMAPNLHELHVEDTGEDVIIMPKWEHEHRQRQAAGGDKKE